MWIARDKCNALFFYSTKPDKDEKAGIWFQASVDCFCDNIELDPSLYPEVKWEDEEPRELVLKPINKE